MSLNRAFAPRTSGLWCSVGWEMAICFLRASDIPPIPIFRPIQSLVPRGSGDQSYALQNKWGMWGQLRNSAEFPKFGKFKSLPASVVAVVTSHRGLGGDVPLEGRSLAALEARGQCLGPVAVRRQPLFPHLRQPASKGFVTALEKHTFCEPPLRISP